MKDKNIYLISSVTKDGSIGDSETNSLIHTSSEDMALFKSLTYGHTVIMGRNTWESLPSAPLEGRNNKVISTTVTELEGAEVYTSLEEAIMTSSGETIFIIGGAQTFESAMDFNPILYLSLWKDEELTGDLKFPDFENLSENYEQDMALEREEFEFVRLVPKKEKSAAQVAVDTLVDTWGDSWDIVEGLLGKDVSNLLLRSYGKE